jgi:hypothetical protein
MNVVIYVDEDLDDSMQKRVEYVMQEVFTRLSMTYTFSKKLETCDIIYSRNIYSNDTSVYFSFDPKLYSQNSNSELYYKDLPTLLQQIKNKEIDPFGWVFRLLTNLDEDSMKRSRKNGNINFLDVFKWKQQLSMVPIVEFLSLSISEIMKENGLIKSTKIGFENFKFILTHDQDSSNISNIYEIFTNLCKGILRSDFNFFKKSLIGIKYKIKPYELNPNFGIEKWLHEFTEYNHAFYLSHSSLRLNSINDVKSSSKDRNFPWQKLLNENSNKKVEYGLHSSINTKNKVIYFTNSKQYIENKLNSKIFGVRAHYWSINWRKPFLTFRKMANTGFRYDMSMSWPDHFGLRSGTCLPYRPYDLELEKPLNIFLIPTTVMDSFVIGLSNDSIVKLDTLIYSIKQVNGIINFDWHVESISDLYPYHSYLVTLKDLIKKYVLGPENSSLPFDLIKNWISQMPNKQACSGGYVEHFK